VRAAVSAAAIVLMLAAAGVLALAVVPDFGDDGPPGSRAAVVGASENGVYPALRAVEEIGGSAEQPRDSGVGVYPTLTAPDRLLFPARAALESARRWAAAREGRIAFAVADERGGLSGSDPDARFLSASLIKGMLLVAFLRGLEAAGAQPSQSEQLSLGYMIRLSDNASADSIYRRVGDAGLRDLARRAGMRDFLIAGDWANATVTPADQARLFRGLDRLLPPRFRRLARDLLETVSEPHSWGIPRAARPRWRTFFKGGWRPEAGAEVVHQAALLESGSRQVGIAVMTAEDPSMAYGEQTIEGIARRLLAGGGASPAATVPGRGS